MREIDYKVYKLRVNKNFYFKESSWSFGQQLPQKLSPENLQCCCSVGGQIYTKVCKQNKKNTANFNKN